MEEEQKSSPQKIERNSNKKQAKKKKNLSDSEIKMISTEDKTRSKYYMNFDFYFKRTSFRTMTVFFKNAYKPFFEKWKA